MTVHVSLDLETWGTRPGFDLRSIGATLFVPHTGAVCTPDHIQTQPGYPHGTFYIACDNPIWPEADPLFHSGHWDDTTGEFRKYPLTRDPETVKWWNDQSDEARAAFADPVDLRRALIDFAHWLHSVAGREPYAGDCVEYVPVQRLALWSHGAAFDPPILAAAYEACGLSVPWHYRAPRDTRTAFDLAGIEDHSAWLAQHPGPLGISHHALDDAICQARAVCGAMARLRNA